MKFVITFEKVIFYIGVIGILFSILFIYRLSRDGSAEKLEAIIFDKHTSFVKTNSFVKNISKSSGYPVSIRIPQIGVDSSIEYAGLTNDGKVEAPSGPKNAAWYGLGPRPGEIGSAVIVGHHGWSSISAVFDNLNKLKRGDKIYVKDREGKESIFIMRDSKTYNYKDNSSSVFNSNDGEAHLNLITCDELWNSTLNDYPNRLVVFSDLDLSK